MNLFRYDQITYAEKIYNYGFQTKHKPTELKLLVLYYRDILKYTPHERRDKLESFCKKYLLDYNYEKDFKIIDKVLKHGDDKNNKLIKIESIPIYTSEFDFVNKLDLPYNHKKFVFALLVYTKVKNAICEMRGKESKPSSYVSGEKISYDEVMSMAKISIKLRVHEDLVNELKRVGLVESLNRGCIEILFINNIPLCDDVLFDIKNFEDAGYYFDYYNNVKGVYLCKTCGSPFKARSNRQEYCKQHTYAYEPVQKKIVTCIDCGKDFETDSRLRQIERCKSCYKKYRRNYLSLKENARYNNKVEN